MAALAVMAAAQEGHPLTGTWSGNWGPGAAQRTHITMVMTWDGKTVSGTITPGPDAIPVSAIALDVTHGVAGNWRSDSAARLPTMRSRCSERPETF